MLCVTQWDTPLVLKNRPLKALKYSPSYKVCYRLFLTR